MTEKQPEIESESESALPTEQVGTEPPRLDRPAVNPRQKLRAVSSPPESLAFEPYKFSRIEISPELRKAVSYGQLWRLELEDVRQILPFVLRDKLAPDTRSASSRRGTKTWLERAIIAHGDELRALGCGGVGRCGDRVLWTPAPARSAGR